MMRKLHDHADGTGHYVLDMDAALAVSLMGDGPDRMELTQEEFEELVNDLKEVREEEETEEGPA